MPKGVKAKRADIDAVLLEYYSSGRTVAEICAQHGIPRRTGYQWIERYGHGKRAVNRKCARRAVHMSLDEVELVLLMMCECDKIWKKPTDRAIMRNLEDRLLTVSDELTELQQAF